MKEGKFEITRQEFDDLKSDVKELHKIFDKVTDLAISTKTLAIELKFMREEQNKHNSRIELLEARPVKRYDDIVKYIITTIIGLILGSIAVLLGLK